MLAMANKEASVETTASKSAPVVTPPKSSGKAWWVTPKTKCKLPGSVNVLARWSGGVLCVYKTVHVQKKRHMQRGLHV